MLNKKRSLKELIYNWPSYKISKKRKPIFFMSTDFRDGLQQPGIKQPNLEESVYILHGNLKLGVTDLELGFPANSGQQKRAIALADYAKKENLPIKISCLARTRIENGIPRDIESILPVADAFGKPVEVILIIGSSRLRQYVEHWSLTDMEKWIKKCIRYAKKHNLKVNFLTEDGTRTDPATLKKLYGLAISEGAERVTIADTVGVANPKMVAKLIDFFKKEITGKKNIPIDFHPHNDLGMAVANSLTAYEHGAERIHTTMFGIGERAGNVDLFILATIAHNLGYYHHKLNSMKEIAENAAKLLHVQVNGNHPVVGKNAFATQTGMHAAAILKAKEMGEEDEADLVYGPYCPKVVGQNYRIDVGPLSSQTNVLEALKRIGVRPSKTAVEAVFIMVEKTGAILEDEQILVAVNNH